jgi:uncharacterized membrane protein YagU involved in acid resistance
MCYVHNIKSNDIVGGIIGGIGGGMLFGALMQSMGLMPVIASLVGGQSVAAGWAVHLTISAVTGAVFALLFSHVATTYGSGAVFGLLYGFAWWVLGALVLMPLMLGMGIQIANALNEMNVASFFGHLLFGLVLGLVYVRYRKQQEPLSIGALLRQH